VIGITTTLLELVKERVTELLPTLQNLFLEGLQRSRPLKEIIEVLVFARQRVGHPIAVSLWIKDSDIDSEEDREL
jgi:hypothetical protein